MDELDDNMRAILSVIYTPCLGLIISRDPDWYVCFGDGVCYSPDSDVCDKCYRAYGINGAMWDFLNRPNLRVRHRQVDDGLPDENSYIKLYPFPKK